MHVPRRYDLMLYTRCGRSELGPSAFALGLWQNFGDMQPFDELRRRDDHRRDRAFHVDAPRS
jgi:hypothetical protein